MNDFHPQYDYRAVRGDREPIPDTLAEPDGTTVDLTGRSVQVIVRHTRSGAKVADEPATIEDAGAGSVSYTLTADQTTRAGDHEIEWVVTGGSDDPSTYPVERPRTLGIREDVETDDSTTEPLPEDREVDTLYANALGTAARPVGEEHVKSSHVGEISARNKFEGPIAKIGVVGDLHLDADSHRFTSKADAESRLDTICDNYQSEAVDAVIWIGDIVDGADGVGQQKPNSEIVNNAQYATDYIENQAGSNGNGFPGKQIYVMGNHEQIHGDSTSELNAVYNEFGYADVSETFYTINVKNVTFAVLNTSYTTTDFETSGDDHQLAPNMVSWWKNNVQDLDRPVVPIMHNPISWDRKQDYQSVQNQDTMAAVLSQTSSLMKGFYGHVHNSSAWRNIKEETDQYGNEYVHTGYIFDLDFDETFTPHGVLNVFGGAGFWHFEASYSTEATGRQTTFTDSLERQSGSEAREAYLERGRRRDFEDRMRFSDDVDGLDESAVSGSGKIASYPNVVRIQTGGNGGDSYQATYTKQQTQWGVEWYGTRAFRTSFSVNSTTNEVAHIVMGDIDDKHFGFKLDGSDLYATAWDGSTASPTETLIDSIGGGAIVDAMCIPGDMAQFWLADGQLTTIEGNVPPSGSSGHGNKPMQARITANEAALKYLDIGFWDYFVGREKTYLDPIR